MATKAEIRDKVASKLGIKATGQALRDDRKVDLDAAYDETYETLLALELVGWASDADVPSEFVFPFVALIALSRVTEYGVTGNRLTGIVGGASTAKPRIRELLEDPYFSSAEDAEYF